MCVFECKYIRFKYFVCVCECECVSPLRTTRVASGIGIPIATQLSAFGPYIAKCLKASMVELS